MPYNNGNISNYLWYEGENEICICTKKERGAQIVNRSETTEKGKIETSKQINSNESNTANTKAKTYE